MRERSASSSDIELARQLSRRLAGRGEGTTSAEPRPAQPGYRRFRTSEQASPVAAPLPVREERSEPPPLPSPAGAAPSVTTTAEPAGVRAALAPPPDGISTWEEFLAWSLNTARARAAFVVDSQGFVISSRGNVPADGFAAVGAELCLAMEQLERIDPEAGGLSALELVFHNRRIVGVRASSDEGPFVVGFVVSAAVSDEAQLLITRQLEEKLTQLE